jgi:microsomal prostaglandin-E synthase 2
VEVNPISKKEIKWSDYKKVPILKIDGEQMVDSSGFTCLEPDSVLIKLVFVIFLWCVFANLACFSYADIIDKLFQRIHPDKPAVDSDEEKKWRGYGGSID